jgi:hypothetical protein
MDVSDKLYASAALPLKKEPRNGQEVGWAPEPAWTLWSREKSLAPAGNRTTAVQPVARHYTDWAIAVHTCLLEWNVFQENEPEKNKIYFMSKKLFL